MEKTKPKSSIIFYVLGWIFFAYLYMQILSFNQGGISNIFLGGLYFIQFGIHEAAHIVTAFLPPVITASAGSVSEVLFTSLLVFVAFRAKSYFAAVFTMLWLMLALTSMGNYMADAHMQLMPLIGMGDNPQHDWHFVFGELGLLGSAIVIGTAVKILGAIIGAVGLLLGLLIIINKTKS